MDKLYSIITLGCKVNQAESDSIAESLQKKGWVKPETGNKAEFTIVNTCTVTQKAAMQSRQAVRRAARKSRRIIVTGCHAQIQPEDFKNIEKVSYIVKNKDKLKIPDIICGSCEKKQSSKPVITGRTRPFLKIEDGCDTCCSYCIVPHARGPVRSTPIDQILKDLKKLNARGYKEAVLTGIHIGAYGKDIRTNLYKLLCAIENSKPIYRVRVSSIEPYELTDDIIQLIAGSDIYCKHFHIPLQSGDNYILEKMGRPYKTELFKKKVKKIQDLIPTASIGADIMAGFPGETERSFNKTFSLIQNLPLTYLHVFPFSERPGTIAAKYSGKVEISVIKDRSQKLRVLGASKKESFFKRFKNKNLEIIIEEKRDPKTLLLKGMSSNYIPVLIHGPDSWKNRLISVKVTDINGSNYVTGNIRDLPN